MMQFGDAAFMATVLAILLLIPLVARGCALYALWATGREAEAEERQWCDAECRAHALLREILTEKELRELCENGYLEVHSPNVSGRTYRIRPSQYLPVDVYESGKLVARLCVQPETRLPISDVLLVHKLMIEGNEREYLHEANVVEHNPWHPRGRKESLG